MCHNLYFLHYTQQKLYLIFVLGWLIWIGHTISVYNTAAMKCETFLTIGKDMGRIQRETLVSHLSAKKITQCINVWCVGNPFKKKKILNI